MRVGTLDWLELSFWVWPHTRSRHWDLVAVNVTFSSLFSTSKFFQFPRQLLVWSHTRNASSSLSKVPIVHYYPFSDSQSHIQLIWKVPLTFPILKPPLLSSCLTYCGRNNFPVRKITLNKGWHGKKFLYIGITELNILNACIFLYWKCWKIIVKI